MAYFKEEKLQFLLSLIDIDPNLLPLSAVLGAEKFGEVLKTFAGTTIQFPSEKRLKKIVNKIGHYKHSLIKAVNRGENLPRFRQIASLGLTLDREEVRKSAKAALSLIVLQEYLKSLYDKEDYHITEKDYEDLNDNDKLRLYELNIKELAYRSSVLRAIASITKHIALKTQIT